MPFTENEIVEALENNNIEKIKNILNEISNLPEKKAFKILNISKFWPGNMFTWMVHNRKVNAATISAVASIIGSERAAILAAAEGAYENALHYAVFDSNLDFLEGNKSANKIPVILNILGEKKEAALTSKSKFDGNTPLHLNANNTFVLAVFCNSIDPSKILFIQNKNNKTPIDLMLAENSHIPSIPQFQRLVLIASIQAYLNNSTEKSVLAKIKELLQKLNPLIKDKQLKFLYDAITSQFENPPKLQLTDGTLPEFNLLKGYRFQTGLGESMNMGEAMKYYFTAFEKAHEEQKKLNPKTHEDWFIKATLDSIKNLAIIKLNELIPSDINEKINLYFKRASCYYLQENYVTTKEILNQLIDDIKNLSPEAPEFENFNYLNAITDFNLAQKCDPIDEKLLQAASERGAAPASVQLAELAIHENPSKFIKATQYYIAALNAKYEFDPNKVIPNLSLCLEKLKNDTQLSESELYELRLQVVWAIREKLEVGEKNPQIYKPLLDKLDDFILAKYVTLVYCDAPPAFFNKGKISKELKELADKGSISASFTYSEWREQGLNGLQKSTSDAFTSFWKVILRCINKGDRTELEIKIFKEFQVKAEKKIKTILENVAKSKTKPDFDYEFYQQIYTALAEENLAKRLEQLREIESKFKESYINWYTKLNNKKDNDIEKILAKEVLFPENDNSNKEKKIQDNIEVNLYPLSQSNNTDSLNPSAPLIRYPDLNNLALNSNLTKETVMLSTSNLEETNPLQTQPIIEKKINILPENQNIAAENLSEVNQNTSVVEKAPSSPELPSQEQNVGLEISLDPINDIPNSSSEESLSGNEKSTAEELAPILPEQDFQSEIVQTAIETPVNIENNRYIKIFDLPKVLPANPKVISAEENMNDKESGQVKSIEKNETMLPKIMNKPLPNLNAQIISKASTLLFFNDNKPKKLTTLKTGLEAKQKKREELLKELEKLNKEIKEDEKQIEEFDKQYQKNMERFNKSSEKIKDPKKDWIEKEKQEKEQREIISETEKEEAKEEKSFLI